jgi:hypothetical protein
MRRSVSIVHAMLDPDHPPPKSAVHGSKPHRRTVRGLAAMWLLVGVGAVLIWQLVRTTNEALPVLPTAQPQREATLAPVVAQVTLAPPTDIPEDTPTPRRIRTPRPLINYCASWMKRGEDCTDPFSPPTPTPMLRCDDPRLIGGQFCVWPTPTPAIGRMWD